MELLLIGILTLAAATLFFHSILFSAMRRQETAARLGLRARKQVEGAALFNLFQPLLPNLSRKLKKLSWNSYHHWTERKLIIAGYKGKIEVEEFWAFQLVMGLMIPMVFGFLFGAAHLFSASMAGRFLTMVFFVLLGIGFPCLWIRGQILSRQQAIRLAMAPAVDLISISVEAGLDFIASISRVVDRSSSGPLAEEFRLMLHEIQMGQSRAQALRSLADRIDDMSVSSFAAVLIQADRLGTSIGPALKAQAVKLRTERFQAAERIGAAASQKILFPLVFFIIPAVFVVIFAPIVLQFLFGGMKGMF